MPCTVISTVNPVIHEDGSKCIRYPLPQSDPHVCIKPFIGTGEDLKYLITTYQRYTRSRQRHTCSSSKPKHGNQQCWLGSQIPPVHSRTGLKLCIHWTANAVPPSCSFTFQYKFSHFSVFCILFQQFQYSTKCSIYMNNACTKSS